MKKVILMGISSNVGQKLYHSLKNDFELYTFSTPYLPQHYEELNYRNIDIFDLPALTKALEDIDIVIFYEDPIMRLSKLTQGRFDTLFTLVADNFARASSQVNIEKIIYVKDEMSSMAIADGLSRYGTPVEVTKTRLKRFGKNTRYKTSKEHTIRSVTSSIIPKQWTIKDVAFYYFAWLNSILGDLINVEIQEDKIAINLAKVDEPVMLLELSDYKDGNLTFKIMDGKVLKSNSNNSPRLEFRQLNQEAFIMALHDFEPSMPWWVFTLTQAPFHSLINRVYHVEMIIQDHDVTKQKKSPDQN